MHAFRLTVLVFLLIVSTLCCATNKNILSVDESLNDITINDDHFKKFKNYQSLIFSEALEGLTPIDPHLYEITKPDKTSFFILGSYHNLPLGVFTGSLESYINKAPCVYVEGSHFLFPSKIKTTETNNLKEILGNETFENLKTYLEPVFKIYDSKATLENIDIKDIYMSSMLFDCFFGMDLEFTFLSRRDKVKTLVLDIPFSNLFEKNYEMDLLYLNEEDDNSKGDHSNLELFLPIRIKEFSQDVCPVSKKELEENVKDYRDEKPFEEKKKDKEYEQANVDERNDRWIQILEEAPQDSAVCVGLGHLGGLFAQWKKTGHIIKKL
jgi:hypothetical protein